jgi:hypothetical protein
MWRRVEEAAAAEVVEAAVAAALDADVEGQVVNCLSNKGCNSVSVLIQLPMLQESNRSLKGVAGERGVVQHTPLRFVYSEVRVWKGIFLECEIHLCYLLGQHC